MKNDKSLLRAVISRCFFYNTGYFKRKYNYSQNLIIRFIILKNTRLTGSDTYLTS